MKLFAVLAALIMSVAFCCAQEKPLAASGWRLAVDMQTAPAPTRSVVRLGGLYDFNTHTTMGVAGAKVYEIDLAWKRVANPEIWAVGAVNIGPGHGGVDGVLAEPWYWTRTITAYPLLAVGIPDKGKWHPLAGFSIQFNVLKF